MDELIGTYQSQFVKVHTPLDDRMNSMSRAKKLFLNTITPVMVQILTVISGLVLPALKLEAYGSETCGLVNSISQFLSIISFLELGVGAVVKSSLYRPLAEGKYKEISGIICSARHFFRNLGRILLIYVILLCIIYPLIVKSSFHKGYIVVLIFSSSISLLAQYFFGIVNRLLLNADQKIYIQYILQGMQIVLNFLAWVLLIKNGISIQVAVFVSGLIFLIGPIYMSIYVKKNYKIDYNIIVTEEPIKQKWNGVAQHVAAIILDSTDIVVLSVCASLTDVAIYSVYQMVVSNINSLFVSSMNGIQSLMGDLWAHNEIEKLRNFFDKVEWLTHAITILAFGCTAKLLVPFILVYTKNVTDANYNQPIFGLILVLAFTFCALKNPYNVTILAVGHYRQTQHIFIIAALLNLMISIISVSYWGIVGVAVGTVTAMVYETVAMAVYLSKNVVRRPFVYFVKQMAIDGLEIALGFILTNKFVLHDLNYYEWLILAIKTSLNWSVVCLSVNLIFKREDIIKILHLKKR